MHNEYATLEDLAEATNVVNIAYQIVAMHKTILRQKQQIIELEEYRKNYIELLNNSVEHGDKMMHNMVQILMIDGVSEAILNNGQTKDFP